jgi:hypothetical protein
MTSDKRRISFFDRMNRIEGIMIFHWQAGCLPLIRLRKSQVELSPNYKGTGTLLTNLQAPV